MAQFWEDWSGSTLNAAPAGWTPSFVTANALWRVEADASGHAPAGRRLLVDKNATDRAALFFDAVGAGNADVQIRLLVRNLGGVSQQFGGPGLRMSGIAGSENVVYGAFTVSARIANIQINSGTASVLGYGALTGVYNTSEYYWLTITSSGGTVTTTLASVATPETIIDTASQTAAVSAAGAVGIFASRSSTIMHVLAVGVGTDGDPAPYSALSSTPVAFSGSVSNQTGTEGVAFSLDLSTYFSGSETPFAYSVQAGTLPAGLSLNTSTGVISGTPTTAGVSSGIVIRATDATPDTADSNSFSITINAAGDAENPTLTGAVTFASITQTTYTAQWPAGADNVAVTGYEYQIGSTAGAWTDAGNNLSAAITGRTAGATETVYVRAYDAAGLRSTPAISGEVTLESIPAAGINVTEPLKNNTGTVLANLSGVRVAVLQAADLVSVYESTGLTTNTSGTLATISDAAITTGQQYHVAIKLADGSVGITGPITAS